MLPEDPREILGDLSADLLTKSGYLSGAMRPQTQKSVAELVRTMNCYYSNLIEGHRSTVVQGQIRDGEVKVGHHIPP